MTSGAHAKQLSEELAADSAELNAHLENAGTLLRQLGLGHAGVETPSGDVLALAGSGLILNGKPIAECSRHERCEAASALPMLLARCVQNGEKILEEVRAGLAVAKPIVEALEKAVNK